MFVTAELRESVQKYLVKVDECANWLLENNEANGGETDALTTKLATERALQVAIECTTDAANLVIDALVMRDPGGYADILRVLMEEGVVTKDWFAKFEKALQFRDKLVHHYVDLAATDVHTAATAYAPLLPVYTEALRRYLDIA